VFRVVSRKKRQLPLCNIAADAVGNLNIADFGNHRVRKIDLNGTISAVAGNGLARFPGRAISLSVTSMSTKPVQDLSDPLYETAYALHFSVGVRDHELDRTFEEVNLGNLMSKVMW